MIGFILLLFGIGSAEAFESLPEFQSLTEEEATLFEGPNRLTPEYQSSVLAYLKPARWEYFWLSHPMGVDATAGSTGAKHFMIDHRAKFRVPLTEELEFRFTYTEEGNQERDQTHHVFELLYWPFHWMGVGFYGEATLYKREDDTGLAFFLKPTPRHEVRFFNIFVDVARLRRNDLPDTFDSEHLPYARGLVGRIVGDPETQNGEFLEYALRYEPKTLWNFPTEKIQFHYWKFLTSVWLQKRMTDRVLGNFRFQFDRKVEGKQALPGGTLGPEGWKTDRLFLRAGAVTEGWLPTPGEFEPGLLWAMRRWKTGAGTATYRDLLPYFWFYLPVLARAGTEDRLGLGYDLTWHRSDGPMVLFHAAEEKHHAIEQRFNLTYEFRFKKNLSLKLLASADLDDFGTRRSWEGGNAQLSMLF